MSMGELLRVWVLSVGGLGPGVAGVGGGRLVGSVGFIQLVWGGVEKSGLGVMVGGWRTGGAGCALVGFRGWW